MGDQSPSNRYLSSFKSQIDRSSSPTIGQEQKDRSLSDRRSRSRSRSKSRSPIFSSQDSTENGSGRKKNFKKSMSRSPRREDRFKISRKNDSKWPTGDQSSNTNDQLQKSASTNSASKSNLGPTCSQDFDQPMGEEGSFLVVDETDDLDETADHDEDGIAENTIEDGKSASRDLDESGLEDAGEEKKTGGFKSSSGLENQGSPPSILDGTTAWKVKSEVSEPTEISSIQLQKSSDFDTDPSSGIKDELKIEDDEAIEEDNRTLSELVQEAKSKSASKPSTSAISKPAAFKNPKLEEPVKNRIPTGYRRMCVKVAKMTPFELRLIRHPKFCKFLATTPFVHLDRLSEEEIAAATNRDRSPIEDENQESAIKNISLGSMLEKKAESKIEIKDEPKMEAKNRDKVKMEAKNQGERRMETKDKISTMTEDKEKPKTKIKTETEKEDKLKTTRIEDKLEKTGLIESKIDANADSMVNIDPGVEIEVGKQKKDDMMAPTVGESTETKKPKKVISRIQQKKKKLKRLLNPSDDSPFLDIPGMPSANALWNFKIKKKTTADSPDKPTVETGKALDRMTKKDEALKEKKGPTISSFPIEYSSPLMRLEIETELARKKAEEEEKRRKTLARRRFFSKGRQMARLKTTVDDPGSASGSRLDLDQRQNRRRIGLLGQKPKSPLKDAGLDDISDHGIEDDCSPGDNFNRSHGQERSGSVSRKEGSERKRRRSGSIDQGWRNQGKRSRRSSSRERDRKGGQRSTSRDRNRNRNRNPSQEKWSVKNTSLSQERRNVGRSSSRERQNRSKNSSQGREDSKGSDQRSQVRKDRSSSRSRGRKETSRRSRSRSPRRSWSRSRGRRHSKSPSIRNRTRSRDRRDRSHERGNTRRSQSRERRTNHNRRNRSQERTRSRSQERSHHRSREGSSHRRQRSHSREKSHSRHKKSRSRSQDRKACKETTHGDDRPENIFASDSSVSGDGPVDTKKSDETVPETPAVSQDMLQMVLARLISMWTESNGSPAEFLSDPVIKAALSALINEDGDSNIPPEISSILQAMASSNTESKNVVNQQETDSETQALHMLAGILQGQDVTLPSTSGISSGPVPASTAPVSIAQTDQSDEQFLQTVLAQLTTPSESSTAATTEVSPANLSDLRQTVEALALSEHLNLRPEQRAKARELLPLMVGMERQAREHPGSIKIDVLNHIMAFVAECIAIDVSSLVA